MTRVHYLSSVVPFPGSDGLPPAMDGPSGAHGSDESAPTFPARARPRSQDASAAFPSGLPAGGAFLQGGEAASRLAHNQEIGGASPPPATSFAADGGWPLRDSGGSGGAGGGTLDVSPPLAVVLGMIALHDRLSVEQLLWQLAGERARRIGLGALARAAADHPLSEAGR